MTLVPDRPLNRIDRKVHDGVKKLEQLIEHRLTPVRALGAVLLAGTIGWTASQCVTAAVRGDVQYAVGMGMLVGVQITMGTYRLHRMMNE